MDNFCTETWTIWEFAGQVLMIFKIVIPLIIIILGAMDLGKAVVSSDEKEIKKATGSLVRRFIAGIIIFFIPTIVHVVFTMFDSVQVSGNDICTSCLSNPSTCKSTACDANPGAEGC